MPRPSFDARLWDGYAPFFDAEEGRVFPVDDRELRFYSLMRSRHPGPCLEIGAGSGRLAAPLGSGGLTIGLEPSRGMLGMWTRERLASARPLMALGQEMPFRDGSFSIAVFAYNGLHCLPSREERAALLGEALRVLRPGGVLLLETCPAFSRRPEVTDADRYDFCDGRLRLRLVESVHIDRDSGMIRFDMSYVRGGRDTSRLELELALIDREGLLEEVAAAGFDRIETWGDYDFAPYDPLGSPRLLTLAAREEDRC